MDMKTGIEMQLPAGLALRNRQMRNRLETKFDRDASFPNQWELEQLIGCNHARSIQVRG